MRASIVVLALASALLLTTPAPAAPSVVADLGSCLSLSNLAGSVGAGLVGIQESKPVEIDVDIGTKDQGQRWVVDPVWLAIGALAVIVVIALIVMAARGGEKGTTVVRQ